MEKSKQFRIKYEVHCKLQNFFNKEIIVKNCISELQAKVKLNDYCKKKYGGEFDYLIVVSVNHEKRNLFGNLDGLLEKNSVLDELLDEFKNLLNIKKK